MAQILSSTRSSRLFLCSEVFSFSLSWNRCGMCISKILLTSFNIWHLENTGYQYFFQNFLCFLLFPCFFHMLTSFLTFYIFLCNFIWTPGQAAWRWSASSISNYLCMLPPSIMSYHSAPPRSINPPIFNFDLCCFLRVLICLDFTFLFVLPSLLYVKTNKVCKAKQTETQSCSLNTSTVHANRGNLIAEAGRKKTKQCVFVSEEDYQSLMLVREFKDGLFTLGSHKN